MAAIPQNRPHRLARTHQPTFACLPRAIVVQNVARFFGRPDEVRELLRQDTSNRLVILIPSQP